MATAVEAQINRIIEKFAVLAKSAPVPIGALFTLMLFGKSAVSFNFVFSLFLTLNLTFPD
jgi:hypothetical protein